MKIRLIRGQVVVREDLLADYAQYTHIKIPGVDFSDTPDAIARKRTWHRGIVLAKGEPAKDKWGNEIAQGFEVGDAVVFHFEHHEKSFTRPWTDGKNAVWLPQWCVDAVLEDEEKEVA